jgi:alpha-1,6-mannosyltransferase
VTSVAAVMAAITVVIYTPLSVGTGVGLGWTRTLDTPALILSWMSASTDLGLIGGQVGILGGLGDHTDTVLRLTRGVGLAGAAVLVVMLLLATLRGRIDAVTGAGAGLGAVVLLGPVVHPWYLLWAAIPLAATRGLPRYRRAALAASAVLAVVVPPTGADFNFRAFQLPIAVAAALIMLFLVLWVQRQQLAGRTGADVDALPGRTPQPEPPPFPEPVPGPPPPPGPPDTA